MAKNSCEPWPMVTVNGKEERSKLYQDILKRVGDRPRANWIYASYLSSNTPSIMDTDGYKRTKQGEHKAVDVFKVIDVKQLDSEINNISKEEYNAEFTDINGVRKNFTNAQEALDKADRFNDVHKGLVADVVQHGNIFNIYVSAKSSRTHMIPTKIKEKLKIWDVYKQAFMGLNEPAVSSPTHRDQHPVDIENLSPDIAGTFNANNPDIARDIINLQNTQIDYLRYNGALILLSLDKESAAVKGVIHSFGSIENAAKAIDRINQGINEDEAGNEYSKTKKELLAGAIKICKQVQGMDLNALQAQVASMSENVHKSSPEADIQATLKDLKRKFNIDINEIHLKGAEINSLSEAAASAVIQLQRRIREIESERGKNAEGKKLEKIMRQLLVELNAKKYYSGILYFLSEAVTAEKEVEKIYKSIISSGSELQDAIQQAGALSRIKRIYDQYTPIINALANEHLLIDETIDEYDIANVRKQAQDLKEMFTTYEDLLNSTAKSVMSNALQEIIGEKTADGASTINLVQMAQKDSTWFDLVYSMGNVSNPMVAAIGKVIRDAQATRDKKINELSLRIRRLDNDLYEAGYNSRFMYEDEGHIISDIDWKKYDEARKAYAKSLGSQHLDRWDFRQAMETWEDENTEERVVDTKSGRTERVPNNNYRKPFPILSEAELDYYNAIMQIKGEIGTLLPAYAQKQYLPPQLRRNMVDALSEAKNSKDVIKAFGNKAQNLLVVREDDTEYGEKGIIDGIEYFETEGNYDNTPLRQIPIFFVNKVEAGELLKDFSTGLQHLAGTAINYEAMHNIQDAVEFMSGYTKNMLAMGEVNREDTASNEFFNATQQLHDYSRNTGTERILERFIAQHIYGQKLAPQKGKIAAKFVSNLLGYSSFKALSTNVKGAFSNYIVGEFQMLIEAGAREFYGFKDYWAAHKRLFGDSGVKGEIMDLLTNNMNSKATLFRELFDPLSENFSDKSHKRYYHGMFRQLLSKDCSFIGYASGEYLIHYVNMYAVLNHQKVYLDGKKISLYDAFEVTDKISGNSELVLKDGVTDEYGNPITMDSKYIQDVRNTIKYVNDTTHGAMNPEDKGVIHQYLLGKAAAQFRQWMVGHYSRRFRSRHFEYTLGTEREGYYVSLGKFLTSDEVKDLWKDGKKWNAVGMFMKDWVTFVTRAKIQWSNLDKMQQSNVRRALTEMTMYVMLISLNFALGEPDDHKGDFWRRWWIYQVRRLILETEASMPHPNMVGNFVTILNSPFGGLETFQGLTYMFTGLFNGDLYKRIQSGPHKNEIKYWRNLKKYDAPFFKDWEQLQNMENDDAIFRIFDTSPTLRK